MINELTAAASGSPTHPAAMETMWLAKGEEEGEQMRGPSRTPFERVAKCSSKDAVGALEPKCTRAARVADYTPAGAKSLADRVGVCCTGSCEQGKQFRRLLDFSLRV